MALEDIECPECHKPIVGAAREKHARDHWNFSDPQFKNYASKEAQERLAILLGKEEK